MLNKIRKSWIAKVTALTLVVSLLAEIAAPTAAYALTSGPSQPEVQSFEPIATTDMVDLFTGDFNYNIPIMQVGHYPINLFYHGGVGMDQEASWTGLGWNINPGVINRNMRGLPDDFNGDAIEKTLSMKPDVNVALRVGLKLETLGYQVPASASFSLKYNNYKGIGYSVGVGLGKSIGGGTLGLNFELGNTEGVSMSASYENKMDIGKNIKGAKGQLSLGFNSRSGLKALSLELSGAIDTKYFKNDFGGSASLISFVAPTFTPTVTPGMGSFLGSLKFAVGAEASVVLGGASIGADVQVNGLMNRDAKEYPAAGYLYAHENDEAGILQDINRDKEVGLNKFTTQLHTTNHSYDTYAVSGQGTGGMYRPYRGNVGMVFDPVTDNSNAEGFSGANLALGAELGAGYLAEIGVDINAGVSLSYMGPWKNDFLAFDELQFTNDPEDSDIFHEEVYFKTVGEKTTVDQDFYDKILDTRAVTFPLSPEFFDTKAKKIFEDNDHNQADISSEIFRQQRDRRNQHINYLTAEDASLGGFDRKLTFYVPGLADPITEERITTNERLGHHVSEIVVTNPDGTRYVYGLPAYNYTQQEYSFNVEPDESENILDPATGLISYTDNDMSPDNDKGRDHFYSKEVTPAYAYAYLLTAVLSPDYVDVDDNGISDDDWGTYTKINYFRAHKNYEWRTPYSNTDHIANYNRGLKSDIKDDKASVVYGTKEIYYVHSVQTKTHVAEFILNVNAGETIRPDGKGVADVHGAMDAAQSLRSLQKIVLYSRPDRLVNEGSAVPIKTAHFTYDNSRCEGIPNAEGGGEDNEGKLTLTQLHFTYGNNTSGALSPYLFEYNGANPGYNMKGSDRWGNYKENNPTLPNSEFPYAMQDKETADINAAAWSLTGINLPSGGHIEVGYESDDYAYVQNRRAGIMTNVIAITDTYLQTSGTTLYDYDDHHLFLHFDIDEEKYPETEWADVSAIVADMMQGIDTLYFNFEIDLDKDTKEETVTGYAAVDGYGGYGEDPGAMRGWVKLKAVEMGTGWDATRGVNPISKAAWQFTRVYRPAIAYEGSDWTEVEQGLTVDNVIWGILSSVNSICQMIAGFNQMMEVKGKGRKVNTERAWIRLNAPSGGKLGGGQRVQKIEFSDKWDEMTAAETGMMYGQSFEYKDADGNSSGVAAYEPLIGGDENACRMPLSHYSFERTLAPDDDHYIEGPLGEQFFPAATVGYSMVTVKNIKPEDIGGEITRHGSGRTVHEFYTAKEFPVYTETTPFLPEIKAANPILSFLNMFTRDYATATQGFAIELNDMHGKQKAVTVYAENDPANTLPQPAVSEVRYFYKTEPDLVGSQKLNNEVLVMDKKGEVTPAYIGKDIEMVVDTKEKSDYNMGVGVQLNIDIFAVGVFPIIIPVPWPDISVSQRRLRTAVNTKIINRFGIQERTQATQNGGATISTWNEIYDKETGEVLLTRTVNEHYDQLLNHDEDFIYNFNYPAHFAFDRMGPAYKNTGVKGQITIGSGTLDSPPHATNVAVLNLSDDDEKDLYDAFVPGDEVILVGESNTFKAWVLDKEIDTGDNEGLVSFIKENGDPVHTILAEDYFFKIIRSGRRNQQSLSVGSVVSRKSPIVTDELTIGDATEVLNSSATVYSDEWQTPADKGLIESESYTCDLGEYGDDLATLLTDLKTLTPDPFESDETDIDYDPVPAFLENEDCEEISLESHTVFSEDLSSHVLFGLFQYHDCASRDGDGYQGCIYFIQLPEGVEPGDVVSIDDEVSYTSETDLPGNLFPFIEEAFEGENYTAEQYYLTVSTATEEYIVEFVVMGLIPDDHYVSNCFMDIEKNCSTSISASACGSGETEYVNPYLTGLRGIWRAEKGYAYNTSREYSGTGNDLSVREDGEYSDFDAFWRPDVDGITGVAYDWILPVEINNPDPDDNKWVWTSEVTKYHPAGYEVENMDALGRYSSALFHYWYTQPSALASNAQYREIAFDGFEDYRFQEGYGPGSCHYLDHWSFMDAIDPALDLNIYAVHTGKKSLEIDEESSFTVRRPVQDEPPVLGDHNDFMERYELKGIDKLGIFTPDVLKRYVIGMWVNKYDDMNDYADIKVNIRFYDDSPTPVEIDAETFDLVGGQTAIEGWKRFEQTFTIPDNTFFIDVEIVNDNDANAIYVDDIRIHPFNSNMKTFVYDPVSLRLTAQLDENNYATFYEYDDQGNLIRTKKETERGIVTLQENRQSMHKQP